MDFSLSSSLVGSAVSNPDKLALDLQFAADKTLTARKGPTPVFTRASSGTFVGSDGLIQSAGNNVARFDHDPVTLACKGLLIEESRTNLLRQSENFGTTWTASQLNTTGIPAYLNVATAPDGTTTADKLIANIVGTTHQFRQDVTLVSGTTYSITCYFKADEQQFASISVVGVANGNADWVSLFNVSSTPSAGFFNGFTSTSVTNVGNGWIRCAVILTATASGSLNVRIGGSSSITGGSQFYMGDNSSGILVWGAQLEAGSFPTSYIPTTTASVIRSADVCSITGSDFSGFYNQTEGTINYKASTAQPGNSVVVYSVTDGTTSNLIQSSPGTASFTVLRLGASQVSLNHGTFAVGVAASQASAYKLNDFASSKDGGTVLVDSAGTPPSVSQIGLGSQNAAAGRINGHIAYFRYFKKRLSNQKLQTLTT